eukprot:COSAG05_NODE_18285_length_310_cov_1.848341_1_plen_39_part_10
MLTLPGFCVPIAALFGCVTEALRRSAEWRWTVYAAQVGR